ncbi:hypothetical protein [Kitasatospora sp. NPDC057223]|uniref:hypothetical protein n=1 Tax=Kitasatospora sp. NPDC057223 TaxID=3346055 RepID=UPI0036277002
MPYEPTLNDMARQAWQGKQDSRDPHAKARADESVFLAQDVATQILGFDAADQLAWRADPCAGGEVNAARADLPDTPGWYLRWALGPEHGGSVLILHRPCAEGGHRTRIRSLAGLGAHLTKLTDR